MRADGASGGSKPGLDISKNGRLQRKRASKISRYVSDLPALSSWGRDEKDALVKLIRAKTDRDEMRYLHLTQKPWTLTGCVAESGVVDRVAKPWFSHTANQLSP